jgi:hypothetical protein
MCNHGCTGSVEGGGIVVDTSDPTQPQQHTEAEKPERGKGLLTAPWWLILLCIVAAIAVLWLLEELDAFGF